MPNKRVAEEKTFSDMTHRRLLVPRGRDPAYDQPLVELEQAMQEMPDNMRSFSLCLRQLYVEKAVGTNEEAAVKFRQIRDKTKNDAIVYVEGVLPLCTKLISSIDEFFDYFIELDTPSWHSNLPSIEESVFYCAELCKTVKHLHEDIISTLKQRENELVCVMKELDELEKTLERKKATLEKRSERKHYWAWGFVFGENSRMAAQLFASSDKDMAKAVAHGAQAQTQKDAAVAVSKTLIPSLKSFIDGLKKVSNFFLVLVKSQNIANFNMEKENAMEIKRYCQKFIRHLPSVRTDLQAIPTEGTDQNYIDRWLERQERTIKDTCTPKFAKDIISVIAGRLKSKPKALESAAEPSDDKPTRKPDKAQTFSKESYV